MLQFERATRAYRPSAIAAPKMVEDIVCTLKVYEATVVLLPEYETLIRAPNLSDTSFAFTMARSRRSEARLVRLPHAVRVAPRVGRREAVERHL